MADRDSKFDSRLIIYRSRQIAIGVMVAIAILVFALIIRDGMENDKPWQAMALPLSILGLLFILMPRTEKWEYKPWQSRPNRVEQRFIK